MGNRRFRYRLRRWLERVAGSVLIVGPLAVVAGWLAFQHKPGWYRPVQLDESGIELARARAIAMADYVSERMVKGRPFDIVLPDGMVNEWIAALPRLWPDAPSFFGGVLHQPALQFAKGRIQFGGYYNSGTWQAIVSSEQSVAVVDQGRWVEIRLTGAKGGSLPVPRAVLCRVLDPLLASVRARSAASEGVQATDSETGPEPWRKFLSELHSADQLFEGIRIRNRFIWFNGRRPYRIASVEVRDGELHLRIEPL